MKRKALVRKSLKTPKNTLKNIKYILKHLTSKHSKIIGKLTGIRLW